MKNVRFQPFIGKDYSSQKVKFLILGESHYFNENLPEYKNNDKHTKEITNRVLKEFIDYKNGNEPFARWMNTFTKFSNVLKGRKLSNLETISFWESCSFYNYVQWPTTGPRESPTPQQFKDSQKAFEEILEELKPDIVFIWGYRLAGHLDQDLLDRIPSKMVLAHPSSRAFNYLWTEDIQKYISNFPIKNVP